MTGAAVVATGAAVVAAVTGGGDGDEMTGGKLA